MSEKSTTSAPATLKLPTFEGRWKTDGSCFAYVLKTEPEPYGGGTREVNDVTIQIQAPGHSWQEQEAIRDAIVDAMNAKEVSKADLVLRDTGEAFGELAEEPDDPCRDLVAGSTMTRPIRDFYRGAAAYLEEAQRSPVADTHLIGLICEGVRMGREYCRWAKESLGTG